MRNKKITITLVILIIVVLLVLGARFLIGNAEANLEQLKQQVINDIDLSKLDDGIYKGTYKSFPIEAEVEVAIETKKIKAINLVKHRHGQGAAAEVITDSVVKAQSLKVETVSGATYSSKVILKAIENALLNVSN